MGTITAENAKIAVNCLVTGELAVNTFIISLDDSVIVIDPGGNPERIIPVINEYKNILILLTHCHYDHSGATNAILAALPRTKYAAHPECVRQAADKKRNLCQFLMNIDYEVTCKPAFTISDKDEFSFGGITIRALHSTGHSLGHLCYYIPSERILFCGDLLTSEDIGRHDVPGSDLNCMIDDCKVLLSHIAPDSIIYPGHKEEIPASEVKKTNPHLKKFYQQI